jgi:hypothetical protein
MSKVNGYRTRLSEVGAAYQKSTIAAAEWRAVADNRIDYMVSVDTSLSQIVLKTREYEEILGTPCPEELDLSFYEGIRTGEELYRSQVNKLEMISTFLFQICQRAASLETTLSDLLAMSMTMLETQRPECDLVRAPLYTFSDTMETTVINKEDEPGRVVQRSHSPNHPRAKLSEESRNIARSLSRGRPLANHPLVPPGGQRSGSVESIQRGINLPNVTPALPADPAIMSSPEIHGGAVVLNKQRRSHLRGLLGE